MAEVRAEQVWALDEIEAGAWRDLIDAAPPAITAATGMSWTRVDGVTVLLAPRLPSTLFNRAIGVGNGAPATDALIAEVIVRFAAADIADPWIQISAAARPAAIGQWLGARGFAPARRRAWEKLVRGREPAPELATSLAIRELDRSDAAALAIVLCEAHGIPGALAPLVAALVGRRGWRAYGAFDGDALVGGGLLRCDDRDRTAWLGLGGTLPSHRGRGAQRALIARRIADAIAQGATTIATETGVAAPGERNPSLDNLVRCGFRGAGARTNWALMR